MYYMDDVWSYHMNPILTYYASYDSFYPSKQVTLLQLYYELRLPHVKSMQLFGHTLEIIGLYIDPFVMTISVCRIMELPGDGHTHFHQYIHLKKNTTGGMAVLSGVDQLRYSMHFPYCAHAYSLHMQNLQVNDLLEVPFT